MPSGGSERARKGLRQEPINQLITHTHTLTHTYTPTSIRARVLDGYEINKRPSMKYMRATQPHGTARQGTTMPNNILNR